MRFLVLLAFLFTAGCGSAPDTARRAPADPTKQAWYGQTLQELTSLNRQARDLFRRGKQDDAAQIIQFAQPLSTRLNGVVHPTLEAVQAAGDLDQLYGEMLLSNKNYGWARLMFQKNRVRWKYWKPPTEDSARRLKEAEEAIAECDRHINTP